MARARKEGLLLPFMQIKNLAVRVVTSNEDHAGTDNAVYFDIGPVGWELVKPGSQFEAGSDETYALKIDKGLSLTTDDIVWLRLQKKGIGGKTGTPDLPDGGWKPNSLHLIVNGSEWVSFPVQHWLNAQNPVWRKNIRPTWSNARRFARTTRLRPNKKLGPGDESISIFTTTQFKLMGISGWLGTDIPRTCAIGEVRERALSTDGLATIDLELALLNVGGGRRYRFDPGHGVNGPRHLRVEYFFVVAEMLESVPEKGQCVQICGKVKWDTDHEGWYEIHPSGPEDVEIFGKAPCDVANLPSHGGLSLRAAVESDFPGADLALGLRALDPGLGTAHLSVRDLIKSSAF